MVYAAAIAHHWRKEFSQLNATTVNRGPTMCSVTSVPLTRFISAPNTLRRSELEYFWESCLYHSTLQVIYPAEGQQWKLRAQRSPLLRGTIGGYSADLEPPLATPSSPCHRHIKNSESPSCLCDCRLHTSRRRVA